MPRQRKPARIELEKARYRDGKLHQSAVWVIRDGSTKRSTGCSPDDVAGAQEALRVYLGEQHAKLKPEKGAPASEVMIADALRLYWERKGDGPKAVANPTELAGRIRKLLEFWGTMTAAEIRDITCEEYAEKRGSQSAARRELQDLKAAIRLHTRRGFLREYVAITLPEKEEARVDWLTRSEVAKLLRYCWTAREIQKGAPTQKRHLRHLIPYILTGVYTGSRSARIYQASFDYDETRPHVDLDEGIYYRKPAVEKATKKRAGAVRIPDRLLAHMTRWRRDHYRLDQKGNYVMGPPARFLVEYRGRPVNPRKAMSNALVAVFGPAHPFVAHTMRHTCATWMLKDKVSVNDVAAYLSMTREMVEWVYGHHHPDSHRAAGNAFQKSRHGSPTVSRRFEGQKGV